LRYQPKEDFRRLEELRTRPTEEATDPVPDTPITIGSTVPTAVPPTAGVSTLVTTITTTGPTSITTIVDNSGTTTTTIISTVVKGINIESRNDTPATVASTQPVIDIYLDSSDEEEEELPLENKRFKTDKY
jgi:hypothetical protein